LFASPSVDLSGPTGLQHFEVQRVIGQGGYGKVKAVTKLQETPVRWYAMKVVNKETIVDKRRFKEVFRERDLLTTLRNPRICNLYYSFQDAKHLYLVMDIALGGDLRYQLNHNPGGQPFSEERTRIYIAQIALAIAYVHSQGIIHRDVKPENILMSAKGWLMLTDFGIARELNADGYCHSGSGTSGYMPPECYHKHRRHGREADWFALGVTGYELLTRRRPFKGDQIRKASVRALSAPAPNGREKVLEDLRLSDIQLQTLSLSDPCIVFLRELMAPLPTNRLGTEGFEQIEKHAFFNGFPWDKIRDETLPAPFVPNTNRMNAEPDADIHAVFMGAEEERNLRDLTPDEQAMFKDYEYEYRVDVSDTTRKPSGSRKFPEFDGVSASNESDRNIPPDIDIFASNGSLSGTVQTQLLTPHSDDGTVRKEFSFGENSATGTTSTQPELDVVPIQSPKIPVDAPAVPTNSGKTSPTNVAKN